MRALVFSILLALSLGGCASIELARRENTENLLSAAGFEADYVEGDIGWEFWCKEGNPLPQRTLDLLEKHKDKLTELAEVLLNKEVIFKDNLEKIFGKRHYDKSETISEIISEEEE